MANLSNINGKFVVEQTTGFVGVGTTDPSYPIEVLNASAEIALNASGASIYRLKSDSTDAFRINKNGVGDRLIIAGGGAATFSGNVGVAGKTPAFGLSLGQGTGAGNKIAWTDVTPNFAASIYASNSTDKLTFATKNASNAETTALEIDTSQNANFAGNIILNNNLQLQSKDTSGNVRRIMYLDNGDTLVIGNQTTVDDIRFDVDTFGEGAMIIKSSGNVGIGTTDPSSTLTLGNDTGNVAELRVLRSNGISGTYAYVDTVGGTAQFGGTGDTRLRADGNSDITFNTNGVSKYKITSTGGHQWTNDASFNSSFTYSFRDAVGINNPNSVSASATAGYVMSVGRSSSGGVSGGIISQGESHFVRGISFGGGGQGQVMDHYEQGSWTPVIAHHDGSGVIPCTINQSGFVRVGNLVTLSAYITDINPNGNAGGSGPYYGVKGFPYPPSVLTTWNMVYVSGNVTSYGGYMSSASMYFNILNVNGTNGAGHVSGAGVNAWGSNWSCMISATYVIA